MKTRLLTAALAMCTVVAFAQKKEIKRAGKSIAKEDFQKAQNYLNEAESKLDQASDDQKADYYLYKGQVLLGSGENVPADDLLAAADAVTKAKELGNKDADQVMQQVSNILVNSAIADQNEQRFAEASEKLIRSYQLNKQDTSYLYFAASNAVNAKDYDTALEYYNELKDMGYSGKETQYIATNKESGEEEILTSKEQQDLFMKSGDYTDPQVKTSESRSPEIAKNIALIYIQNGETEKAIKAMEDAKKANPGDPNLMQSEADMYYSLGDMEKYQEIMQQIVAQDPDNAVLYYNMGVSSAELGDDKNAIKYYNKALELDPEMENAEINIAYVILGKESGLVEQMNELGTSKADNEKYDELVEKRKDIFKEALPHLEKVFENDPTKIEVARTLMNIYYQLDKTEKAEEMQKAVNDLKANQ